MYRIEKWHKTKEYPKKSLAALRIRHSQTKTIWIQLRWQSQRRKYRTTPKRKPCMRNILNRFQVRISSQCSHFIGHLPFRHAHIAHNGYLIVYLPQVKHAACTLHNRKIKVEKKPKRQKMKPDVAWMGEKSLAYLCRVIESCKYTQMQFNQFFAVVVWSTQTNYTVLQPRRTFGPTYL